MRPNLRLLLLAPLAGSLIFASACGDDAGNGDQDNGSGNGGSAGQQQAPELAWNEVPLGLEAMDAAFDSNVPEDNEMTEANVALGKQLFFDKRLSADGSTSCQTCHQHRYGWTNGERFSTKVGGAQNTRNSPTMYNVGYHGDLYWDGRAPSLEVNIAAAWKGHMNKGEDTQARADEIGAIEGYASQFQDVFGEAPTTENVTKALASFTRSLRAGNSAWDQYEATKDASLVSPEAIAGQKLFTIKGGCIACHLPPLYRSDQYHAVGVGETKDIGRGKIEENNPLAQGAFRVPTLRNITKTAPYFHDGSVSELREAVYIMASGGAQSEFFPTNSPVLQNRNLSDGEIDLIVEFLKTLESTEGFTPPTLPE
ncbi:MAG: cytochrome c peroxidase [Planctomycetota bacterium]